MMKRVVALCVFALLASSVYGQQIFNCSSFSSGTGTCGVNTGGSGPFKALGGIWSVTGSGQLQLAAANSSHRALAVNYTTPVNVQAFTANYTFVPSGNVLAFVLQNTNNQSGYDGISFVAGAGCEGGFFQASNVGVGGQSPNNVFAITMDGYNNLTPAYPPPPGGGPNGFMYSGTALYHAEQDPCKPNAGNPVYNPVDNISTSPVSLNTPENTPNTTTGHVYSVTITYDGQNVTENLFDVTAGGACPGASCFTHTWNGVNVPAIVGGNNTALVGITASTVTAGNAGAVLINSWSYTASSATTPVTGTAKLTVAALAPKVSSIAVTPANTSISVGATQQYTATCTWSDSSTSNCTSSAVAWSSSDTSKASISPVGLASGIAAGSVTITATAK